MLGLILENYIKYRNDLLRLDGGCGGACSLDMTADDMSDASLTEDEFDIIDNNIDYDDGEYIVETIVKVTGSTSELEDIDANYDSDLGYEVIYIPVKFKVTWNEPEYETEYRYTTTVSYANQEVLKGSAAEAALIANGYTYVSSRTVTL